MRTPSLRVCSGFLLFLAVVVSLVASLSFPIIKTLDIVRVKFDDPRTVANGMEELRFGIWNACDVSKEGGDCKPDKPGYIATIAVANSSTAGASTESREDDVDGEDGNEFTVQKALTLGLLAQPIAMVLTIVALLHAIFRRRNIPGKLAFFFAILAAVVHLVSSGICIALLVYINEKLGKVSIEGKAALSLGFWLTLASTLLCFAVLFTTYGDRRVSLRRTAAIVEGAAAAAGSAAAAAYTAGMNSHR